MHHDVAQGIHPNRLLTVKQVSARWQLSETMVRKLIRSGTLPARRYGRSWRIDLLVVEAIETYGLFDPIHVTNCER